MQAIPDHCITLPKVKVYHASVLGEQSMACLDRMKSVNASWRANEANAHACFVPDVVDIEDHLPWCSMQSLHRFGLNGGVLWSLLLLAVRADLVCLQEVGVSGARNYDSNGSMIYLSSGLSAMVSR